MSRWQPDARARLQQAAMTLYSERGYDETTVAEIAERAGLTKRTFFRYFTDKREVLFWGSELLGQMMVAAIEAAPPGLPALDLIAIALDAAAIRFEEVRDFAGPRHRVIASSPELRERELIKAAAMAAAMADALRARGFGDTAADLAAHTAITVMHVTFGQWVEDPSRTPFGQIARNTLAELRQLTAVG
ncbi:MAG TPA: TetR family transcriptional regulator [Trebonia sp.]|jgi:AcrR family transcriptional regulator|nr:TetR family transcriptional regulator [Trebonia sp.]